MSLPTDVTGHEAAEIEVIGAYDEPFDSDMPKRALSESEARVVRGFTSRVQVMAYLQRLPDTLLDIHRFIQWRLLENGSLWQARGCAYITRPLPGTNDIAATEVWHFGKSQPDAEPGAAADGGA